MKIVDGMKNIQVLDVCGCNPRHLSAVQEKGGHAALEDCQFVVLAVQL